MSDQIKILVVDDDPRMLALTSTVLESGGYEVMEAATGKDALQAVKEAQPGLVLLDVMLPDMSGLDVCKQIKADPVLRGTFVVLHSGVSTSSEAQVDGLDIGADGYIVKGIPVKELLARVQSLLRIKQAEDALQRAHDELEERVKARTAELADANQRLVASEKALLERLRFEEFLSSISAKFINVAPDQVDLEIERALKRIVDFFRVSESILIRGYPEENKAVITHAARTENVSPVLIGLDMVPLFPWTSKMLPQGEVVRIDTLDDLPAEAVVDEESYRKLGIRSILTIPVSLEGSVRYSLSISSRLEERVWSEEYIPRLQLLGEIFVTALERKRMEQEVQEAAEEWQATFDSVQDMVMILDPEFKIVRVNAPVPSFLNLPLESILGTHCHTLMHGTSEPIELCPLTRMMKTKRHEEAELYDEERDAWFQVSVAPIFDDQSEITRVVHTVKDITQRKKTEFESFSARRELLRTQRLLRMGELTASLAHELNQPLTSILSNARAALRFLQAGRLDMGELREILEDIAKDDKRAGDIIRSLRSMVKPEEGEQQLVSINDALLEAVSLFRSEAIIRNIRVETDCTDSLPPVTIDKVQIQQVLINLMMNAAESMMDASENRKIIVRTRPHANNGVQVAVRDFGPGIEEKELSRLFEPFFTTKRSGLGMGLSLSRSILEAHGGHIWAENNPDGGATFYFDLPTGKEE